MNSMSSVRMSRHRNAQSTCRSCEPPPQSPIMSATIDHRPWYWASLPEVPLRPALSGAAECDVGVVGGGIAGLSTALHLAQRGYRVALLEAERVGWGASGRSGAQAIFGVAAGQDRLTALLGAAEARRIWDMSI